jgi:hypothetical protein
MLVANPLCWFCHGGAYLYLPVKCIDFRAIYHYRNSLDSHRYSRYGGYLTELYHKLFPRRQVTTYYSHQLMCRVYLSLSFIWFIYELFSMIPLINAQLCNDAQGPLFEYVTGSNLRIVLNSLVLIYCNMLFFFFFFFLLFLFFLDFFLVNVWFQIMR